MSNITIKRVGGMGNDGYWLANTGLWSPCGVFWVHSSGEMPSTTHEYNNKYRLALKQHLDSLATPEAEPETFTGDPIKDKWGEGLYESDLALVAVTGSDIIWYGKNVEQVMVFGYTALGNDVYTKLSDDPAAIINPDLLGGG